HITNSFFKIRAFKGARKVFKGCNNGDPGLEHDRKIRGKFDYFRSFDLTQDSGLCEERGNRVCPPDIDDGKPLRGKRCKSCGDVLCLCNTAYDGPVRIDGLIGKIAHPAALIASSKVVIPSAAFLRADSISGTIPFFN